MSICILTGEQAQRRSPFTTPLTNKARVACRLVDLGAKLGKPEEEQSKFDTALEKIHETVVADARKAGVHPDVWWGLLTDPKAAARTAAELNDTPEEAAARLLPPPAESTDEGAWRGEDGKFTADPAEDADGVPETFTTGDATIDAALADKTNAQAEADAAALRAEVKALLAGNQNQAIERINSTDSVELLRAAAEVETRVKPTSAISKRIEALTVGAE